MNDAYEIIVRAVGREGYVSNRRMAQTEAMLEWRMSDDNGTLPSEDERRAIQAGLMKTFHGRFGLNPYRVSIAILATTPSRRPGATWSAYRYGVNEGDDDGKN